MLRIEPVSAGQGELWFIRQYHAGAGALYNTGAALHFHGQLNRKILAECVTAVMMRHEALRTGIATDPDCPGRLRQEIHPRTALMPAIIAAHPKSYHSRMHETINRPFQMDRPPLMRALLLHWGKRRHCLILVMHHAIIDGWSGRIVLADLCRSYRRSGIELSSEPVCQYREFCRWQHDQRGGGLFEQQRDFWRGHLAGGNKMPAVPSGTADAVQDFHSAREAFLLQPALCSRLRAIAARAGCTLVAVTLSLYLLAVMHMEGGRPIPVGIPVGKRRYPEWEETVGYFVNLTLFWPPAHAAGTFPDWLHRVQSRLLGVLDNADLPFQEVMKLVRELNPDFPAGLPVKHLFVFQNFPRPEVQWPGVRVRMERLKPECCHFHFMLELAPSGDGLECEMEYQTRHFSASDVQNFKALFKRLLYKVSHEPAIRVSQLVQADHT